MQGEARRERGRARSSHDDAVDALAFGEGPVGESPHGDEVGAGGLGVGDHGASVGWVGGCGGDRRAREGLLFAGGGDRFRIQSDALIYLVPRRGLELTSAEVVAENGLGRTRRAQASPSCARHETGCRRPRRWAESCRVFVRRHHRAIPGSLSPLPAVPSRASDEWRRPDHCRHPSPEIRVARATVPVATSGSLPRTMAQTQADRYPGFVRIRCEGPIRLGVRFRPT